MTPRNLRRDIPRARELDLGPLVTTEDYDWSDQRAARSQRSTAETEGDEARFTGVRLARMVVDRDSDRYNRALLDGTIRQSWARNSDAPHLEEIRKAGLDPLFEPERCPFPVANISGERFRAAFFVLGNVGWVYSPASAKSANSRGDNEFTATLCQLISQHRPVVVDAVAFTRLVRSLEYGPQLGAVCGQFVDVVRAGDHVLDFKEHREWAQFLWVFLSAMAASERDEIQRRHTAGVLVKYSVNKWLIQPDQVPFGYVYRTDQETIEPDPSSRQAVLQLLRILICDLPRLRLRHRPVNPRRRRDAVQLTSVTGCVPLSDCSSTARTAPSGPCRTQLT